MFSSDSGARPGDQNRSCRWSYRSKLPKPGGHEKL